MIIIEDRLVNACIRHTKFSVTCKVFIHVLQVWITVKTHPYQSSFTSIRLIKINLIEIFGVSLLFQSLHDFCKPGLNSLKNEFIYIVHRHKVSNAL